MYAFLFAFIQI